MKTEFDDSFVLCYVDGPWAYFTTQALDKQWGDGWNDAPYEHNAGPPYSFQEHDLLKGHAQWSIAKVAWEGNFATPSSCYNNSPWSVQEINAGKVPWLFQARDGASAIRIMAGTTLDEFKRRVEHGGGCVYFPDHLR